MAEQEAQMDTMMKDRMEMQKLMASGTEEQQKALMLRMVME
jgi:hypothetical protein|tara:strand:- start:235 stop:357 length:123 start_codon:yes stop_codon:yes gene_type:complete